MTRPISENMAATKHKPPMPLMKLKRSVGMAKAMMDKAKQMQTSTNPTKKVPAAPLPQAKSMRDVHRQSSSKEHNFHNEPSLTNGPVCEVTQPQPASEMMPKIIAKPSRRGKIHLQRV
uniref:Uncharacterized protein n=1 Tax=Micrurus lemniscatus lemniscatus TaxID=129467 RepID=A0A2D4HWZ1_MICLE